METKHILRKQLNTLPARFILGCIGHTNQLSPRMNNRLVDSISNELGQIEEIMNVKVFPNAPPNYVREMGTQNLSTTIFILEDRGVYTDIHPLKKKSIKIEDQFRIPFGGRVFNLNPGAVGTYGLILSSHKPTGNRPDISTYAYGPQPQLFFGKDSYYERVSIWDGKRMRVISYIKEENKFPEYYRGDRMKRLERLVITLRNSNIPVELLSTRYQQR